MSYAEVHLHTHDSNINMVEVVTKIEQYIQKAQELGLSNIVVTNHGVLTNWYNNKKKLESAGFKYVHALESFVTWSIENKVRDNFHLSLYAKNFDGFKELNKMVSKSFNREDGHYYYSPRMTWDEIKATSDNIIISTACLGGLMWKLDNERQTEVIEFLKANKHRVFLEVQPHNHEEQKALNKKLVKLSKETGIPLIAGGDVHALDHEHDMTRKVLQRSKNVCFEDEDTFDLTMKSYDERVEMFLLQGALKRDEIEEALNNTNVLVDMVEPFELDYSKKYPKVVEGDSLEIFKEKIKEGLSYRNIYAKPLEERKLYAERIQYELETYIANGAVDYMLLEDLVKSYARSKGIRYGYGRGSVSGSIIAYLMQITEMNSIERNLNFERFMSKERISLADVDTDYPVERRWEVQEFVVNGIPNVHSAPIMTANTIALKGAIRDIGRGLEMPLDEVDLIAKTVEENESELRKKYPTLFKHVDICQGVITSVGQHACFEGDTPVKTIEGYKNIRDVQIGDKVLTHKNRYMPVVDTMVTESNDIYTLKVGSTIPITVTGNHPVYIRKVNIKRSRKDGKDVRWREWDNPVWKNVSDIKIGEDWIGTAINQESIIPQYDEYPHLPFDNKDFWWLIGRYLGDGWTESYERNISDVVKWTEKRTIICCSQHEGEYKEIQKVLTNLDMLESTGIEFNNRMEVARTTFKFHIGSKSNHELYNYLQSLGKYAHGKKLNGDILNLPTELLESFLDGYFSADGSYNKKRDAQSFKTVSRELALGIASCVNKVYKRHCSFAVLPSKIEFIEGRQVKSKKKYNVVFTKDVREKERSFYEDGYIWTRVQSVTKTDRNEQMYNLTVLDDSSYTASNLIAHNCGIVVSPIPLDENMGLMTTSDSIYPITMLNMKEIDAQNFVKLDVLGLDTVSIISNTCMMAGIDYLTPNNTDMNDEAVWQSMREDNVNIFQWESDFAKQILQDLFSKETIAKIKEKNPNFSYMDLFSLGNAILRPAGASYRDEVIMGNFYDNGHEALNEFLAPTLGRLVYQEQLIEFLVKFCQYTAGHADLVRRGIGKKSKEIMDVEVPKIKRAFISTMVQEYNTPVEKAREIAEPFIQVFIDSANYGFSVNHSDAYSWLGYICGYLRYYYPLEFLTACLNANKGKKEKINELLKYAKSKGIEIKQIAYGFSKAEYMYDKESNSIYQGIESIKYLNEMVGNGLYDFKQKYGNHNSFVDLLVDLYDGSLYEADAYCDRKYCSKCKKLVKEYEDNIEKYGEYNEDEYSDYGSMMIGIENQLLERCDKCQYLKTERVVETSVLEAFNDTDKLQLLLTHEKKKNIQMHSNNGFSINARQMNILITLDFFKEFGNNKALLDIFNKFDKRYSAKHKLKTKAERYAECIAFEKEVLKENKKLSLSEQSIAEMEYLGHVICIRENLDKNIYFVTDMKKNKQNVRFFAYQYATGNMFEFKITNKNYSNLEFGINDIIQILDVSVKPKTVKVGDKWLPSPTEKTFWVNRMKYVKRGKQ